MLTRLSPVFGETGHFSACLMQLHQLGHMQTHEVRMNIQDRENLDEALFPVAVAAVAAKVPANTIRSWFQREQVTLQGRDAKASANGLPHLLTLRSVLALAATAELVRQGMKPGDAYSSACEWIYICEEYEGKERLDAGLYSDSYTVLISSPYGRSTKIIAVPLEGGNKLSIPLFDVFGMQRNGARLIWLDYIHRDAIGVCAGYLRED